MEYRKGGSEKREGLKPEMSSLSTGDFHGDGIIGGTNCLKLCCMTEEFMSIGLGNHLLFLDSGVLPSKLVGNNCILASFAISLDCVFVFTERGRSFVRYCQSRINAGVIGWRVDFP